ncbi:MAG: WecB/TagA/CpsF family glycosyltransferase [Actinomycetota bacterium]
MADATPTTTRSADGVDRVRLFGLEFVDAPSLTPIVEQVLLGNVGDDRLPVLVTPNVDIMVQLEASPGSVERRLFEAARFCLPDGQPLVLASGLVGRRLRSRLTGSGLFIDVWPRLVSEAMPVAVVASSSEVAERLRREHPKATFVVPPMFHADDAGAIEEIVDHLLADAVATRPELLLVGIGHPKDARIINSLLDRWPARLGPPPLCLGLGGSFAMYLGLKKRAPDWVQRVGMEWFYRFVQEPRRLFHRYFVRDRAFVGVVWREWRRRRIAPRA